MTCLDVGQISQEAMLSGYDRAERRAILEHKYFLGIELGFDPGMVAALESWNNHYGPQWRKMRMIFDCQCQIELIRRHFESMKASGVEITLEDAARDWIARYANQWRSGRDS